MTDIQIAPPAPTTDAPAGSPLASLLQRADEVRAQHLLQTTVPGYKPRLVVAYKAVADEAQRERIAAKREKLEAVERNVMVSCDFLIECCVGIFSEDAAGKLVSTADSWADLDADGTITKIHGDPITFGDPRLAEMLGMDVSEPGWQVRNVLRLHPTEGMVLRFANAVLEFSGYGRLDGYIAKNS
jgi:hypothetical protein